jgi:RimJ/RimL family protein N-acetyltransferase
MTPRADVILSPDPLPRVAGGVVLRRLAVSDLPAFQAYRGDSLLATYQGWSPTPDAEASAFLGRMGAAPMLQPGEWSQIGIAEPGGLLIGDIGLFLSDDGRYAEIGITLRRESHGRGLGTAAAREAVNLVFEQTDAERVRGVVDARNGPSIRLLQRVGMRMLESRETVFREEPCVEHVYVIFRPHRR